MNHDLARSPAEERLLDAALAQVFMSQRSTVAVRARPWLAAALVLLGVTVTAASMWLARGAARDAAQEPAPLPPQVRAEGKTAIEALPADTENLAAVILQPDHAKVLSRFPKLRRLALSPLKVHIGPINTGKRLAVWDAPPADLLAEVAKLPALESLQLGANIAMSPAVLEPLRRCASLREIELCGNAVLLDEALTAALTAIPSLRSLRLVGIRVDPRAFSRLRGSPLTALHVSLAAGFDADAWSAVCEWKTLEALSFGFFGFRSQESPWRPAPADLQRLAELPKLRSLEFHACDLLDDDLLALPKNLTELKVTGHKLTPTGVASLKAFGTLRTLDLTLGVSPTLSGLFDRRPAEQLAAEVEAFADAVAALRLAKLRYLGKLSPALRQALAAQPDLADLELITDPIERQDLADLAKAPALRHLSLSGQAVGGGPSLDALAALRECRSLRTLDVSVSEKRGEPGLDEAALQQQLGDRVTVRVQRTLLTVKK